MDELEKSWKFVKLHLHLHLFSDIQEKGILRGLSTHQDEKMHGPIRQIYLHRTNFKDVGDQVNFIIWFDFLALSSWQITRIEHQCVVSGLIQAQLEHLDEYLTPEASNEVPTDLENPTDNPHFSIGSKLHPVTFGELEHSDARFVRLHIRLSKFISELLLASHIPLPEGQYVKYTANDMVHISSLHFNFWKYQTELMM